MKCMWSGSDINHTVYGADVISITTPVCTVYLQAIAWTVEFIDDLINSKRTCACDRILFLFTLPSFRIVRQCSMYISVQQLECRKSVIYFVLKLALFHKIVHKVLSHNGSFQYISVADVIEKHKSKEHTICTLIEINCFWVTEKNQFAVSFVTFAAVEECIWAKIRSLSTILWIVGAKMHQFVNRLFVCVSTNNHIFFEAEKNICRTILRRFRKTMTLPFVYCLICIH